jgi:hypothetical protein
MSSVSCVSPLAKVPEIFGQGYVVEKREREIPKGTVETFDKTQTTYGTAKTKLTEPNLISAQPDCGAETRAPPRPIARLALEAPTATVEPIAHWPANRVAPWGADGVCASLGSATHVGTDDDRVHRGQRGTHVPQNRRG